MKNMYHIVLVIWALMLIFSGCKKDETDSIPNQTVEIVPLKIGNQWINRTIDIGFGDTTYGSTTILRDTIINGVTWFIQENEDVGNNTFTFNKIDGLYIYYPNSTPPRLYYKYPAHIGDHYYNYTFDDSVKVLSTDTNITVLGGTFMCYLYEIDWLTNSYSSHVFISPGIGIIKKISFDSNLPWLSVELSSYHLN